MSEHTNDKNAFGVPSIPNGMLLLVIFREGNDIRVMRQSEIRNSAEGIACLDELAYTMHELTTWLAKQAGVPTAERTYVDDGFGV